VVEVTSLETGDRVLLPLTSHGLVAEVVGTAGGKLLVFETRKDGGYVTAYAPEYGGPRTAPLVVPAGEWPDACSLLPLAGLPGYQAVPLMKPFHGIRWPKPNTCEFLPPGDTRARVAVTVVWVARSAREARELVDSELAYARGVTGQMPFVAPWQADGAYLHGRRDRDDLHTKAFAVGGPVIVDISADGDEDLTRRVATAVAARLRALYPQGVVQIP
jgi:hypothetical protein